MSTPTSSLGTGTKVHIYLPLQPQASRANLSPDLWITPLDVSKEKRILLVDDEENVLESVEMLIRHLGHDVLTASNGAEGLHLFKQYMEQIDLVITDYEMPLINGARLIQLIRDLVPGIRIILFTGLESKGRVDELNKLKVDSILFKPFTAESLKTEIGQLLS